MSAAASDNIRFELTRALYGQAPTAMAAALTVALYVVWTMWDKVPHDTILGWAGALALTQIIRLWAYFKYRAEQPGVIERADYWAHWYMLYMAVTGVVWASAPFLFFVPDNPLSHALVMMALYGIGAGSVAGTMYHPPTMVMYLAFCFVPLGVKLFMIGGPDYIVLGIATLSFMAIMMSFGKVQARAVVEAIRVRNQNVDLVEELREQKDAAESARVRAEEANRAKSQFLAAASHDLRQPLHALGLFSASLREMNPEPEKRAVVDQVYTSIDSLESLFDELLDISKLDAGFVKPNPTHFPVDRVLSTMRMQYSKSASEKGLELRVVASSAIVHTDATLLSRILSNLISNAIRYTSHGRILLGCRRREGRLSVEVWDTGRGIPSDQHERVFEEFYQLDNPERDRRKGLGLGLATVKRLTTLLDHPLQLESTVGRGTVFRIEVPLGNAAEVATAPVPAAETTDLLAGKRVVVVDDELSVRQGMHELLARWGCLPVTAASGEEALSLLDSSGAPDVIVSDYRLAGGETGARAVDAIRSRYGEQIPVMLITGDTSPERLRETQTTGHLLQHKPVRPVQLRAALNHLLTRPTETGT
jgi:signal transduction histidine kinase